MARSARSRGVAVVLLAGLLLSATPALRVATVAAAVPAAVNGDPQEAVESGVVLAGGGAGWGGAADEARLGGDSSRIDVSDDGVLWVADGSRAGLLMDGRLIVVARDLGEIRDVAARPDGSAYVLTSAALLSVSRAGVRTTAASVPTGFDARRLAILSDGRPVVAGNALVKVLSAGALVDLGGASQPWRGITDIADGPAGSLYVRTVGQDAYWVWRRDDEGVVTKVAGTGTGAGQLISPEHPSVPARSYSLTSGGDLQVHTGTGEVWLTGGQQYGSGYAVVLRVSPTGQLSAAALAEAPCTYAQLAGTGSASRLGCLAPDGLSGVRGLSGASPPFVVGAVVVGAADDVESSDDLVATDVYLPELRDVAMTTDGRVWMATPMGLRYVHDDETVRTAFRSGSPELPDGATALAADGVDVIVATGAGQVLRVAPGPTGPGDSRVTDVGTGWSSADDVAVHAGSVYVADSGLAAVRRVEGMTSTDVLTGRAFSSVAAGPRGVAASFPSGIVERTAEGERLLSTSTAGKLGAWDGRWLLGGGTIRDIRPDGAIGVLLGHRAGGVRAEGRGGEVLVAEQHRAILVTGPVPSWVPPTPAGLTATARPGYVELAWEDTGFFQDEIDVRRGPPPPTAWHWQTGTCAGPLRVERGAARIWCDRAAADGLIAPDVDYAATVLRRSSVSIGAHTSAEVQAAPVTVTARSLADDGPPPAPVLTSVTASRFSVQVDWSREPNVPDRQDRDIVRFKSGTTPPASPDDGTEVTFFNDGFAYVTLDDGLEPDTDYSFAIFSMDYRGNVSEPAVATGRLDTTAPGPVTDVNVTATHRAAMVTWAAPTDPDLKGTVVQIVPSGQPMTADGCDGATEDVSLNSGGLAHGTAYTVWLRTCDRSGNTGEPVSQSFTTPTDTTPPGPPTDVSASVTGTTITVTWAPPADSDLSGVIVRMVEGTEPPSGPSDGIVGNLVTATPPISIFRNLKGATAYTVVAFARDLNGNDSPPSTAVTVVTDADTTPPTLSDTALTAFAQGDGTVMVRLTPPFPVNDFAGVHLTVTPAARFPMEPGDGIVLDDLRCPMPQFCTRSITLPTQDTPYRITAWPFDVTGNVGAPVSTTAQSSLTDPALPSSPWSVQAYAVDQNQLRVTWRGASAGVGGAGVITHYEVEVDQRDGGIVAVAVPLWLLQTNVAGLHGGAPLTVRVYAVSAAGRSVSPGTATAMPEDALIPSPVSSLAAIGRYGDAATVSWTGSPSFDVRNYAVRWVTGSVPPATPTSGTGLMTPTPTATLSGLPAGRDVAVAVFALDWAGNISPRRSVLVRGTRLSMTNSPTTVTYGTPTRAAGRLLRADAVALAGQRVTVRRRLVGSTTWSVVGSAVTDSRGNWSLTVPVARRGEIEAYYANGPASGSRTTKAVGVRLAVSAKAPASARHRTPLVVTGKVRPSMRGRAVSLQRYFSGAWRTVDKGRTSSTGTFKLAIKPPRGTWSLRVLAAGDRSHFAGKSVKRRTRVY